MTKLRQSYFRKKNLKSSKALVSKLLEDYDEDSPCYLYNSNHLNCDHHCSYCGDTHSCSSGIDFCPACRDNRCSLIHIFAYKILSFFKEDEGFGQIKDRIPDCPNELKYQKNIAINSFLSQSPKSTKLTEDKTFQLVVCSFREKPYPSSTELFEQLKQHSNRLFLDDNMVEMFSTAMKQALTTQEDLQVIQRLLRQFPKHSVESETLIILLLFSQFWLRFPSDWKTQNTDNLNSKDRLFSLIKHLFVKYPAPKL